MDEKCYFYSAMIYKTPGKFAEPAASKSGIWKDQDAITAMKGIIEEANLVNGNCTVHFTAFNEVS